MWALRLVPLRSAYAQLWHEHHQMVVQNLSRNANGESLSDIFEYMAQGQQSYLYMLEFFLLGGALPALLIYFGIAARTVWKVRCRTR